MSSISSLHVIATHDALAQLGKALGAAALATQLSGGMA
jgi:hypothetical protein